MGPAAFFNVREVAAVVVFSLFQGLFFLEMKFKQIETQPRAAVLHDFGRDLLARHT